MLSGLLLLCGLHAVTAQAQSGPYHGLPIGSMFYTSDATKGSLYAADPKTVVAVNFRHHGQVGCATFMAGPPKKAEGSGVESTGEGILLPIRVRPVAEAETEGKRVRRQLPVGFPWNLGNSQVFGNLRVPPGGTFDQSGPGRSHDPFRGIDLELGPEDPEWKGVTGQPATEGPTTGAPVTRIRAMPTMKMKMMPIAEIMRMRHEGRTTVKNPARIYPATTVLPDRAEIQREVEQRTAPSEVLILNNRVQSTTTRRYQPGPVPTRRYPATSPPRSRSQYINPSRVERPKPRFNHVTPKGWTPTYQYTRRTRTRVTQPPNRQPVQAQTFNRFSAPRAPPLLNPSTTQGPFRTITTQPTTTTTPEPTTTTRPTTTSTPEPTTTSTRAPTTPTTTPPPSTTTFRRETAAPPQPPTTVVQVVIPTEPAPPPPAKKQQAHKSEGGLNLIFFDAMPPSFQEKPNIGRGLIFVENETGIEAPPLNKAFWGPLPRYPELYQVHTEAPTTTEPPTTTTAATTTEEPSTTTEEEDVIRFGGAAAPSFGAPGSGPPGRASVVRNSEQVYEFGRAAVENTVEEEAASTTTQDPNAPSWWVVEDPRANRPRPGQPPADEEAEETPTPLPSSFEVKDVFHPPTLPKPRDGETYVIPDVENEVLLIQLPTPFQLSDFEWFGIYDHCRGHRTSYVSLEDIRPPQETLVEGLEGWQYDTKSADIVVMNCNTLLVRGFTFTGHNYTKAYFYVGVGDFPNAIQQHVQAEVIGVDKSEPLRDYANEDVLVRLPGNWKTFDISFISVFSPEIRTSFGHAEIPPVVVPPCEEFFKK